MDINVRLMNGATAQVQNLEKLDELFDKGEISRASYREAYKALVHFSEKEQGDTFKATTAEGTTAQRPANSGKSEANQQAIIDAAKSMKINEARTTFVDKQGRGTFEIRTTNLRAASQDIVDGKEEFDLGSSEKKVHKRLKQNIERMDRALNVKEIIIVPDEDTDPKGYEAAMDKIAANKAAIKEGTVTILKGKPLRGAKKMHEKAKAEYDKAVKKFEELNKEFEAATTENERLSIIQRAVPQAAKIEKNYYAAHMFNDDGTINKNNYQMTMLQYAGYDYKANLDERSAVRDTATLTKKNGKEKRLGNTSARKMFEAAGIDVERNYSLLYKAGAFTGTMALGALLPVVFGGSALAHAVATATATAVAGGNSTTSGTPSAGTNGPVTQDGGTVTETVTKTAEAWDKAGGTASRLLAGALGAAPGATMLALVVKDNGARDLFKGHSVREVLDGRAKLGKYANDVIKAAKDYADKNGITSDELETIFTAAIAAENTGKKANKNELAATLAAVLSKVKAAIDVINAHPDLRLKDPILVEGKNPDTTTQNTTTQDNDDAVVQNCEMTAVQDPDTNEEIKPIPYKLGKNENFANAVAAKYGIKDPALNAKVRRYIREQMGLPKSGSKNGKTVIPNINVNGQNWYDAYFFPAKLPDELGGYVYKDNPVKKSTNEKGPGVSARGNENVQVITRHGKVYLKDCNGNRQEFQGTLQQAQAHAAAINAQNK